tara:strand:- start:1954 stop:2097 length:144 start_codon:yes stop_codon:yes gene_type:complete
VDDMSVPEMHEIAAFLETLTDVDYNKTIPTNILRGLPPDGLIQGTVN